ncbi:hypothetical protein SEA_MEMENTOMORI_51 [Microbacterium phage MementoMori]|uniref:Uncharacterized protein n=1 Tax=Microbacterium phage MementoMori TaxID=2201436 RepID=A0A2Z4Q5W1_9CAUD|nr:hypothetical protein HOT41_gp58 [Microbacterium phage MementoMori]AWY05305.1 hypothetical protein SEA_MEMENTOMORI_51 [Microbacterium phage MementoMori]
MPGSLQDNAIRHALERGIIPTPTGRFEVQGKRVTCRLCGMSGYGDVEPTVHTASPWQLAHMMPHAYPCSCGARFTAPWHLAKHILPQRRTPAHETRGEHHWAVPDA